MNPKPWGPRRPFSGRAVELLIKRLMDIGGAAAGLVVLLPVLLLAGLATRATLGRPVFFRQTRPGLNGRPFTPFKFRTMRAGNEPDAVRTTPVGRFLRHASIDELPQLWNVLIGEMSLVGPRPLLMDYLDRYPPRLRQRQAMRPGLTGWSQVNGRNGISWERKFAYDVEYVENWTLGLDVKVLLMTIVKTLRRSGVEGEGGDFLPEMLGYPANTHHSDLKGKKTAEAVPEGDWEWSRPVRTSAFQPSAAKERKPPI